MILDYFKRTFAKPNVSAKNFFHRIQVQFLFLLLRVQVEILNQF